MIAQKTRYALRSLLFLAEEQGGAPVQLARIAETQRVPPKYLELIMLDLKKAGPREERARAQGRLSACRGRPSEISFGEIVRTMEGPIALVSCASVNFYAPCGDCHDEATCAIRRAFTILRDQSTAVLDSISLAQGAELGRAAGQRQVRGAQDWTTASAAQLDGALVHGGDRVATVHGARLRGLRDAADRRELPLDQRATCEAERRCGKRPAATASATSPSQWRC